MSRKELIRGHGAGAGAAKGEVFHGSACLSAGAIRHQGGAGEAVLVDIAQGAVLAGGYQLAAQVIAAGHITGGDVHFTVSIDIENRLAVFNLLHAVTVTVIEELSGSAVIRYGGWLVFHVPGKRLRAAGNHVAVGIVSIVSGAYSSDGMFVGTGVGISHTILRKDIAKRIGDFLVPNLFDFLKNRSMSRVLVISGMEFLKATWTGQPKNVEEFADRIKTWDKLPCLIFVMQYDKVLETYDFGRRFSYTFVIDQKETLAL